MTVMRVSSARIWWGTSRVTRRSSRARVARTDSTAPGRVDPSMSDDGSFVFFQSPVALAVGALNDQVDGVKLRKDR